MPGGVIVHEQDFILVAQRLSQTIKAKGGPFVEVETVVIVSTVGNNRKHLGSSPHRTFLARIQLAGLQTAFSVVLFSKRASL